MKSQPYIAHTHMGQYGKVVRRVRIYSIVEECLSLGRYQQHVRVRVRGDFVPHCATELRGPGQPKDYRFGDKISISEIERTVECLSG